LRILFNTFERQKKQTTTLKSFIHIFAVFLCLCSLLQAQVPGFMGKRWHLSYGLNASPSFANANLQNRFLNTIQEVQLGYVTHEKWEIDAVGRFYQTIYNNKQALTNGKTVANYYRLSNTSVGLVFKHFKRNYVAPWGAYFMFGPVLNLVTTNYDEYMFVASRVNNHDTLISNFGPETQRFYKGDLLFGWGQHRILAGNILVDYGFNCQLLALLDDFKFLDFTQSTVYNQSNYIEETSAKRARGMNRFNLFLKVCFLF
jgi:hypothetical protein